MNLADIKQALFETNLNFDSNMPNEVQAFFIKNGIEPDKQNINLCSIAVAAIISELKQVPCAGDKGYTKYGITIELAMSHLNGKSKEQFLQTVSSMIAKNSTLNNQLSQKVKNILLSYRLFKKYRKSFQQLWSETEIDSFLKNDLLSIFWLIYLLKKNSKQEICEDFQQQVKLLIVLLKSIFQYWISSVNTTVAQSTIQKNLNLRVNEQYFLLYHVQYFNQIQKLYSMRYNDELLDLKKFSKNPIRIARFLDDISNYFYKQREIFSDNNYIDEVSYLQLKRMIVPEPIKKKEFALPILKFQISSSNQQKSDSISQDKKQNKNDSNTITGKPINNLIIAQNLPKMTPFRERIDKLGETPCSNRLMNLEWVRNCLHFMNRPQKNQLFKKVFFLNQQQSLVEFELKARKQLFYLVQEFIPKCLMKDKRVNDLFTFFKFLIIQIFQGHKQGQNLQMFKYIKTFSTILCLSCDMFNFVYSAHVSQYRKQCEIFGVPLIEPLKPINWIGKNIDKPYELNNYLYFLQKRIVIQQIWYDETGYNLIRSQQQFHESYSIGYNDMIVWQRLVKHILDRIEELSNQVRLQHKQIKKIQNFLELILKQKPFLLHKNKIDQIIICCMTSFLTINEIHQKQTLQKVFSDYNKIQMSSNQNKDGLLGHGKEMTLAEFYSEVFQPEIQDIVSTNIKDTDFLLTPIRKSYEKQYYGKVQLTPFSRKYPQKKIDFSQSIKSIGSLFSGQKLNQSLSFPMFKNKNSFSPNTSYRTKLFMKTQKMDEENGEIINQKQHCNQINNLVIQKGLDIYNNSAINNELKENQNC